MATMKAWAMFTSLAVILWTCATVTAHDELNITCTLTPVITDQLKTKLFDYFDKSSKTKLLEYKLVFDNYTNNQKCKDSATSFENWRWYRAQEHGSVYFFFSEEYFLTTENLIKIFKSSVELKFQTTPANCLSNFTCRRLQTLIRNALISDFNLKKELQKLDIELSKNVEICLNDHKIGMFKHYRCCGFSRLNEYYCNDQSVYFKIVYFCVPFVIAIPILIYILYSLSLSYRTIHFGIYSEINSEINSLKKADGYTTKAASKFIKMGDSTFLLRDYYIHKLRLFFDDFSSYIMRLYMTWRTNSPYSNLNIAMTSPRKSIYFPDNITPSITTLVLEIFVLNFPFLILSFETYYAEDYIWFIVILIFCIMNFIILVIFLIKRNLEFSFHRLTLREFKHGADFLKQLFFLIYAAPMFYFSIWWYVKLMFTLIAFAFFEFEKADVIISIYLVVLIYVYGFCETDNSQLRKCLKDFKVALDDVVSKQERTKDFIFLLECEESSKPSTDNQEHTTGTSDVCDSSLDASTDRTDLVISSDTTAKSNFKESLDDSERNKNIFVSNKLPLFYDSEGNLYVWKELFYNFCHKYWREQTKSWLTFIVKATMSCILSCYLLMLGMLVWYFEDFYDYSFLKTVFIIIAGGMLPKVLGMVFGPRHGDVPLQNTDNGFQIFVQKEIEAIYKKASVSGAPPRDVGLPLQNTFNGFEISVRKEIESIYKIASKNVLLFVGRTGNGKSSSIRSILKDGTTEPGTSTTAPGTSTTASGTSTTAPGTSTPAPGTSTTAPGTSTTAPGTSTTAPGTSTTAPGTSTIQPGSDTTTHTVGDLEMINGTGIGDNGEDMIVNAEDLVKSISRKLTNGFTALVFVVKYGVRFTKQEVDAVETVKSIFGNDVFKNWGIILMTFGDNFYLDHDDPSSFKAWCQNQSGGFKNLFDECNERCVLFNNKTSNSLELEKQRELLMEQVEAVRKLSSGLYTSAHLKSAERSRNFWARKNKGKVTYNTFN